MSMVKVNIARKDRYVAAMVKALAVAIGGHSAASGQKNDLLVDRDYFVFEFNNYDMAANFSGAVRKYIPGILAAAEEPIKRYGYS